MEQHLAVSEANVSRLKQVAQAKESFFPEWRQPTRNHRLASERDADVTAFGFVRHNTSGDAQVAVYRPDRVRSQSRSACAVKALRLSSVASTQLTPLGNTTWPDRTRYTSGVRAPGGAMPVWANVRAASIRRRRARMMSESVVPRCSRVRS